MRIPRIYQSIKLNTGDLLYLDKTASHHLRVLRLSEGSPLVLFNGQGGEFIAVIQSIREKNITIRVGSFFDKMVESPLSIHLGQAVAKGDKMDMLIQKAVELGVTEITPLFTMRSEVKLSEERLEKRLEHWQGIIIHACEQCGRNKIPQLNQPKNIMDWVSFVESDLKLVLDPTEGKKIDDLPKSLSSVTVVIGSEGGLNTLEIQEAQKNRFVPLKLGPRVLRTETAPLAILSILQHRWGDL